MEIATLYHFTIAALAAAGGLQLIQLLIADVAGIKNGHNPGVTIKADHDKFHFRSARTVANMNESVAIFILFALAGILAGADPAWLGRLAWGYTLARVLYAVCYWFNIKKLRSTMFGISLLALAGMGVITLMALPG